MTPLARQTVFLVCAAGFAGVLLWGMHGLPPFGDYRGPYGYLLNAAAPHERHIANVISAINYDYRGVDTLGEEFILFTSVIGVGLLLRQERDEGESDEPDAAPVRDVVEQSEAVRVIGMTFMGFTVLLGIYVVLHGHLTPGGGFQGGSIVATGWMLSYIAGRHHTFQRLSPQAVVDTVEAVGAGAYAVIGLVTLATGAAFLQNVLPQGSLGTFLSSGTIWLINFAVGVEVAAGMVVVILEFLEQLVAIRQHGEKQQQQEGDKG